MSWMMNGDQPWAAVVRADDVTTGRWVPYVHVADLDAAVETAVAAGGTVVLPRTAGPAGHAVTLADPAGALIALWVPFATTD
jgi:predicted enzyme related to lactoylglutathione lyase